MENCIILHKDNIEKLRILRKRLSFHNPDFNNIKCYLRKDLVRLEKCEFIFSPWQMPQLTSTEIEYYFPNLKAVFYAGGTTKYFARPFLEKNIKIFSATKINGLAVAEFTMAQILLANKGYFYFSNSKFSILKYIRTGSYAEYRGGGKKTSRKLWIHNRNSWFRKHWE